MRARLFFLCSLGCLGALGCGASEPREADIFHDPALRASEVEPASEDDRAVLARLASDPAPGALEVGGSTYEIDAAYAAASGRRCRHVRDGSAERLACETTEGWRFVPGLLGGP